VTGDDGDGASPEAADAGDEGTVATGEEKVSRKSKK
jgi:hypothetical protein